jgi:hypothetical protein
MSESETIYPWEKAYIAAACETDVSKKRDRIHEAAAAIEQRRSRPVTNSDEQLALIAADIGLGKLISQWTDKRA